jgi:DNA-binding MarR family transcriptional regulator
VTRREDVFVELKDKEQLATEILQSWLKNAWIYPMRGPEDKIFLRVTPGGRLKMRRRIGEVEEALGVKGTDLLKQEEEGTLPAERDKLELAMMVRAYTSERRFIES